MFILQVKNIRDPHLFWQQHPEYKLGMLYPSLDGAIVVLQPSLAL